MSKDGASSSWRPPSTSIDSSDTEPSPGSRTLFGTHKRPPATSRLRVAIEEYLAAPSADTLANLHQLTRTPTAEQLFFSRQQSTLTLQLLDALAQHVLTVAQAADDAQSQAPFVGDVHELLELVYLFAQHTAIGYPSHALGKLLQWLVADIVASSLANGGEASDSTTLKLQLLVVAEVLKLNAGVRLYAKEMKHVKEFYRALTIVLNSTDDDAELLVFSMTILARLVLTESLGAKLFSPKNVEQACDLVFSILDGSAPSVRDATRRHRSASNSDSILSTPTLLQCVSVDLLTELADRAENRKLLEQHTKLTPLVDMLFMGVSLNGNAAQIRVAVYFLTALASLGHALRKLLAQSLTDADVLLRVLQVTLHPTKLVAIVTTQLILKVLGDDLRAVRSLFDAPTSVQKLSPVLAGHVRCIAEATSLVQQTEHVEALGASDEYLHSADVCQLLAKLCDFPLLRAVCVQTISLNQSATLIQLEAAQLSTGDPQSLLRFQPRLSLHLVILLSKLVSEPSVADKTKRTLSQFLQSPEVALVLGAGVFNRSDKDVVVETLLLLHTLLTESSNKRFVAFGLAEGVLSIGQRASEATEALQAAITAHEETTATSAQTIAKLQHELQLTLRRQDDAKSKQDAELQSIKSKFIDQVRQSDDALTQTRESYEAKLRALSAQCESLGQLVNKKSGSVQHRDLLLQEHRAKQVALEDENAELQRKVEVLEVRLDEVAHALAVATEEMHIRERETTELRDEMAAISSDYTAQREELEVVHDTIKRLEHELSEKCAAHEDTYKELVLLAKAHKVVTDERTEMTRVAETTRDELTRLESLTTALESRLQEKKDLADQLERKIGRLEDASDAAQNALEDEREKRKAASRDVDDLKKAHRKLESDMALFEIRFAEQRLVLDAKDDHVRKCEDEIRHLNNEVSKQVKLQALIHQLSSGSGAGADATSFGTRSFLARDS